MNKFLTVVGQLKFRGTSVLFRLPHSPVRRQGDPYNYPNRPSCPSPCPSPVTIKLTMDTPKGESNEEEKMELEVPSPSLGGKE